MPRDLFGVPVKIGIVGSRRRDTEADLEIVKQALLKVYEAGDTLVSGGCKKGGDRFAEILAERLGAPIILHLPDKSRLDQALLKKAPRAAYAKINYDRNTLIAADSDILIACVAPDRKGGTEDTVKKFKRLHPDKELILV